MQKQKSVNNAIGKKLPKKHIIIAAICLLLALIIAGGVVFYNVNQSRLDKGNYLRKSVVYESDNFEVNSAMLTYYFYQSYQDFMNDGAFDTSSIDSEKSLKKSTYKDGTTWYEFFEQEAVSVARAHILFAEAAMKEGYELTEEEIAEIEARTATVDLKKVGRGITHSDVIDAEKLIAVGQKYYSAVGKAAFTDEEYQKKLVENLKILGDCSYYSYEISYGDDIKEKDAKKLAKEISKAKTPEEFVSAVNEHHVNNHSHDDDGHVHEHDLNTLKTDDVKYADCGEELGDWIFDKERKAGDTKVIKNKKDSKYTVYMVDAPATESNSALVNIRVIRLMAQTADEIIAANKKIMDIQNEFLVSSQSEVVFTELVNKYSEDTETAKNGGLITNYQSGQIADDVLGGKLNEWCFSAERKAGDYKILQSNEGMNFVYMSVSNKRWKEGAEQLLLKDWRSEYCDTLEEHIKITFNKGAVKKMPIDY